jgi:hypothetical protein
MLSRMNKTISIESICPAPKSGAFGLSTGLFHRRELRANHPDFDFSNCPLEIAKGTVRQKTLNVATHLKINGI